jgi:hypothetical protein
MPLAFGKVVTEITPGGPFWEAEPEHQDYLEKYPDGYTCHFIRPNWKLPQRTEKMNQTRKKFQHDKASRSALVRFH